VCGKHQQLMEMSGGEYATFIGDVSQQQQQQQQHRSKKQTRKHAG